MVSRDKFFSNKEKFDRALMRVREISDQFSDVNSVVVSYDEEADEFSIRVNFDPSIVAFPQGIDSFPDEIEGLKVILDRENYDEKKRPVEIGKLATPQAVSEPLRPGASISGENATSGSIGALVANETGSVFVLSNWHVLHGTLGGPNDVTLQPGKSDGGFKPDFRVGGLSQYFLDEGGDAAISELDTEREVSTIIKATRDTLIGTDDFYPTLVLKKSGRTTGVTYGKVKEFGLYKIPYWGIGSVEITGFKIVSTNGEVVSEEGDSGSVWYEETSGLAVGLHFAGNQLENFALACPIQPILDRFDVRFHSEGVDSA